MNQWYARLERGGDGSTELVASAMGASYDIRCYGNEIFDDFDEICGEYGAMASAIGSSGILDLGHTNPLLILDVVVAPQWRGHNIRPHSLRWMGTVLGDIGSLYLVPTPSPTRLDTDGEWISDWELPRSESGAMRKVRAAYRRGGFTHLRSGTWWTPFDSAEDEIGLIRTVLSVLES